MIDCLFFMLYFKENLYVNYFFSDLFIELYLPMHSMTACVLCSSGSSTTNTNKPNKPKQIEDFVGEWLTAFPHNAPTKFKIATDPIRSHPVSSSSLNYLWSSSRVFCLLNFFLIKIQYSFFNFTLKTVHWGIFLSRYLNKK